MAGSGASNDEVVLEIEHCIRIFKSGRVERYFGSDPIPPSTDASTGVASKDRTISPDVAVRLYLPPVAATGSGDGTKKLPLLVYFHGGGFVLHTAFNAVFHAYLASLAARARAIVVSVDYRLAPEHPLPAAYEDSWRALVWAASHASGGSCCGTSEEAEEEPWLTEHADFSRLFLGGESAGANIAHHTAMRAGVEELGHGVKVNSLVLIHPYFLGGDSSESDEMGMALLRELVRLWPVVCPGTSGCDDPWINPMSDGAPSLAGLGCARALVCVGGKDAMRGRGRLYCEKLMGSGWHGEVEVWEADGQGHGFHLFCPTSTQTKAQVRVITDFMSR